MKKALLFVALLALGLSSAMAASGVDWSQYNWLGNGSGNGAYTDKIKVQKVAEINEIVNLQAPGWASEPGIYLTTFSGISSCSVSSDIQGAGIILHLSAFTQKETEVEIVNAGGAFTFYVYYEDGEEGSAEPVAVEGVSLPETAKVSIGKTVTLEPVFTPARPANKNVTWSTSNADVATVADGVVTGVSEGTATITVTTEDGGFTAGCLVTVVDLPTAEETTWNGDDVNIAKGCAAWVSAINGGTGPEYITNDVIDNACQLLVTGAQPVEWMVIDLGYNYDINKLQIVTTGDRKDKEFAIYTAPAQDVEPAFAVGNMALEDAAWEIAFYAEDDYANNGVVYHAYNVDLQDVRYIKYVGTVRNHNDQWGTAFVEVRVAGTTNDDSASRPAAVNVAGSCALFAGESVAEKISVVNAGGGELEINPELLSVASSDAQVATAAIDGDKVVVTAVAAGSAVVTVTYGELTAQMNVTVKAELAVAAPVPTVNADNVLALYSDAYDCTRQYRWIHWGWTEDGKEIDIDGDKAFRAQNFVYYGSQFMDRTDVTGYAYYHIDVYPTANTTLGVVLITAKEAGGNNDERGVTVPLVANKWNAVDIPLADFEANGVVDLDRLYQIKYVKEVYPAGGQLNSDGSYDVYFDNIYFYNAPAEEFSFSVDVDASASTVSGEEASLKYTITHTAADDVDHYHIWAQAYTPANEQHRAAAVVLGETDHSDMSNLSGYLNLAGLDPEHVTNVSFHAQAIMKDNTAVNPSNWHEGDEAGSIGTFVLDPQSGTTTSIIGINAAEQVAPVYYNLQGIRVNGALTPGIYVVRQGDKTSKVLVK